MLARQISESRRMLKDGEKDRVVRVFVSSTFRDMIEDRNELMSQVWPALRQLCREREVDFVEVDLRWGITEEEAKRKGTLRHCLAEITRCRPYFIALLGERYGWVPGPEVYSATLLREERWLKQAVARQSVTELEIRHGVLNDPDKASRSFFYFRDPGYVESLPAAKRGDFASEDPEAAEKLKQLKASIRTTCAGRKLSLRENYSNPRQLASRVLADLRAAIDADFPPNEAPDVWTREDSDHEAYGKSRRTRFYVARSDYYRRLNAFAEDGAGNRGLIVFGESGAGKSALLANWVARWRRAHPNDFVFQHYIGSSPLSAGHLSLIRRLMVAILRWCADSAGEGGLQAEEARVPVGAAEIVRDLPEYLNRLTVLAKQKGVRAVVVIDALNQLEDSEHGRSLVWLPFRLAGRLRFVVSTLPGDTRDVLQPRKWPVLTVEPLTKKERTHLIAGYLGHFSQGLSGERIARVAAAPAAGNPLYLKSLLGDLRATGAHERLESQIADYLQAADVPALFGKILTRYERDYDSVRPGLVRDALSMLWAARRGLTESELLEVLKPSRQEHLPAAFWAPIRYALEDGIIDRDGVMSFAHDHLRLAVERRYVTETGAAGALRLRLAETFAERPTDARQADELPWLLRQAERKPGLRACLLDISRFVLIQRRDEHELLAYWVWLGQDRVMGKAYLRSFEAWSREPHRRSQNIARAGNDLGYFLHQSFLHPEAEVVMRRALVIDERSAGAKDPSVARDLNNLAQVLKATNRLPEAERLMRRALVVWERSVGVEHPNVASALSNLAVLLKLTDRFGEAEEKMRRALAINEHLYGPDHPTVARDSSNLAQLLQVMDRFKDAEDLLHRALVIDARTYGTSHPEVASDMNNLALLLQATNRMVEAETLLGQALAMREQWLGAQHPLVADSLNNLAWLFQETGRSKAAEPLLWRALDIYEKSDEAQHPKITGALNNLALLLLATNRTEEAEALVRRAVAIDEQSYGGRHTEVAIDLSNLARVLQARSRYEEAEPISRRALSIFQHRLGVDHEQVANALNNLAALLKARNRVVEAQRLSGRALEIFLKCGHASGHAHPRLEMAAKNYANLLKATGRTPSQMSAQLKTIGRPFGVLFGEESPAHPARGSG